MSDFLPLNGTDHIEIYVGNAKQSAHYFKTAFGFQDLAYAGLETGLKDRTSYVLRQDKIILVLTSPLTSTSPINDHLVKHGDGVKNCALWVDDATKSWHETTSRGAVSAFEPYTLTDEHGSVVLAGIKAYGDTVHVFVERKNYRGAFMPGYMPLKRAFQPADCGLKFIDHMVGNVGWGEMNTWVDFYAKVMGFNQLVSFDDKDISTEYTALMSKVMSNGDGRIKFPINEPAEGRKKSQIEEYIDFYGGPGVQHLALATDNIIETVTELRARGVDFLAIPDSYYDEVLDRVGEIDEDLAPLRELGILVDRDEEGYLLQLFTKPLMDRPTVFVEIIQRKGAKSFGKGNFKALFESIEREQERRGTL
jgi:4-hydroxyphenylpyruvate dioxygenase